jgi:dihydrofolate synthase/folylpolyglutamate synthase
MVVGMSSDKDLNRCGQAILELVSQDASRVHLVQAASPRAATLQQLLEIPGMRENAHYDLKDPSVTTQIATAVDLSLQAKAAADIKDKDNYKEELLVVCGSVFIMADAREALGIDEPKDSAYIAHVGGPGARNGQENFGDSK